MKYENIRKAIFLNRPNRFIAEIEIQGRTEIAHVKNTGRCKEILVPGAEIYVSENNSPKRKTRFDLISVMKGKRLINIDSQAPNKAVLEWLRAGNLISADYIKPETVYKNSRFDFYTEGKCGKSFIEVKGVTLENEDVVSFPDAPTLRGAKHMAELVEAKKEGFGAYVVFVVQMKGVKYFTPNFVNDPEFSEQLIRAYEEGVKIYAYDCCINECEMNIADEVKVVLRR